MMRVIISTLGGKDAPVRFLLRNNPADKLILVAGKPVKDIPGMEPIPGKEEINPVEIAEKIKSDLDKAIGLEVEIQAVNAFDFMECFETMVNVIRGEARNERLVAVGPGTAILSGAAICACWIEGVEALYVQEKPEKIVTLPIPSLLRLKSIGKTKRKILIALLNGKKSGSEIATEVGIAKNTASQHLSSLEEWKLIKSKPGREMKRYEGKKYEETYTNKRIKEWELTDVGKFHAMMARVDTWEKFMEE